MLRTTAALAAAASFIIPLCRASSWIDLAGSETSSPTSSATLPHKPEDWPRVFEQHLNAGDLEAVMALYRCGGSLRDAVRRDTGRSGCDSRGAGRNDCRKNTISEPCRKGGYHWRYRAVGTPTLRARRSIAPGTACQFRAKPSKCSAANRTAVGS